MFPAVLHNGLPPFAPGVVSESGAGDEDQDDQSDNAQHDERAVSDVHENYIFGFGLSGSAALVDRLEIAESVIKKIDGIRELHGGFVFHHHTDQFQAVFLGAGNQILPGFGSITRLASNQIFIRILFPGEKFIFGIRDQLPGKGRALRDNVAGRAGHLTEQIVGKEFLPDESQIVGRSVMLIVVDAVGGHEVGVRTAQFLSRLVHQIHKSFDAPADMFADGVAAFVAGAHQKAIQRLLHGDSLPDLNADIGILAPVDAVDRFRIQAVRILVVLAG